MTVHAGSGLHALHGEVVAVGGEVTLQGLEEEGVGHSLEGAVLVVHEDGKHAEDVSTGQSVRYTVQVEGGQVTDY